MSRISRFNAILSISFVVMCVSKKPEQKKKVANVSIPIQLYARIKKRLKETDFTSVSDYVSYVLREVLASLEEEEEVFSKEEEEKVKERLRALGYID